MVADHPLLGVGLGNWGNAYPQYMSRQLSGLNPEYAHSDPLQLLSEVGIVGVLPIVLLFVFTIGRGFRVWRKSLKLEGSLKERIHLFSLLIGAITVAIASFFDFPFRAESILAQTAVLLALMTFYIDRLENPTSSDIAESTSPYIH